MRRLLTLIALILLLSVKLVHAEVISQTSWLLHDVDSEEIVGENGAAVNAFDGDQLTVWHTEWYLTNPDPAHPHEIQIDLGAVYDIEGFRYLPRGCLEDGCINGRISLYEFYLSTDGLDWGNAVAEGIFVNDATEKEVLFSPVTAQYVRLIALSEVNGNPWTSMAELNVLGTTPAALAISPTTATVQVGDSQSFSATGGEPPYSFSLFDNQSGASIDAVTGIYTAGSTGGVTDTVRVTDNAAATADATVTVTAAPPPLAISPTTATVQVGDSQSFSATGGEPPYSFSLFDNQSGASIDAVTGIYTAGSTGGVTDTVRVTDNAAATADATVTVTAAPPPLAISPTTATVQVGDSQNFSATGGVPPYSFSLFDNQSGASIDAVTGIYTAGPTGGVTDIVRVTDNASASADATVTVTAAPPPLAISPTTATVQVGDSQSFSATGGVPPYSFSLFDNQSGASIDAVTGIYTAGSTGGVTDTVRVTDNAAATADATVTVTAAAALIDQTNWTLLDVDSEEIVGENGAAVNAFDGDQLTVWHTEWYLTNPDPAHPHEIQIDLGAVYDIEGFRYLPRGCLEDGCINGRISLYEFYLSTDGLDWGNAVAEGIFVNDATEKEVLFSPVTAQYVRLIALSEVNGNPWTSMAELNVLGTTPAALAISPTTATVQVGNTQSFSATGGVPPYSFSLFDNQSGASIDAVTGIYTAGSTGGVTDTVRVTDNAAATADATVTVTAAPPPLAISPTTATVQVGDSQSFSATGGVPPYSFSLFDNQSGASIDAVTGIYTAGSTGGVTDTVRVTDNAAATADATVTVTAAPPPLAISPTTATVQVGDSQNFSATGGVPPYSFSLFDNQSGATIDAATGIYTAGPTGGVTDTVRVTDNAAATADATVTVTAAPPPLAISPTTATVQVGDSQNFSATGGVPPYSFSLFDNQSGATIDAATGIYTAGPTGGVTDTVRVTDNAAATADATVTVTAAPPPLAISPTTATVQVGDSQNFSATGGVPPYSFSLFDNQSGASIDAVTGIYTAGPTGGVTDTVRVTDNASATADATVTVTAAAALIDQTNWSLLYVDSEELVGGNNGAINAFDGDQTTIWHTEWFESNPPHPHEIQIDLGAVYYIEGFRYLPRQDFYPNGRIDLYEFNVSTNLLDWGNVIAQGSFQNDFYEKETAFPEVSARYVKLVALNEVNGNPWTSMAELNVIGTSFSGNFGPNGIIDTPEDNLTINPGEEVIFTGTGMDVDDDLPLTYHWNFSDPSIPDQLIEDPGTVTFNNPGTYIVTFTVTDALDSADSTPATRILKVLDGAVDPLIPQTFWTLQAVDSEELYGENGAAINAFDGDQTSVWHTEWYLTNPDPPHPHDIQINLGSAYAIDGFRYLPRDCPEEGCVNGRISKYQSYVSPDGVNWGNAVASGTFLNDSTEKAILFAPKMGQFVRLVALSEVNGNPWTSMAEINIEGQCNSPYVRILDPRNDDVQPQPNLSVTGSVCLNSAVHNGWGVKYILDGGVQEQVVILPPDGIIQPDTFKVTFEGLSLTDHLIDAYIVDDQGVEVPGEVTHDQVTHVGIGDYYVALGDSITFGTGDNEPLDNTSSDGRNVGLGYPPILNNLLTTAKGYPHYIANEGIGAETSAGGLARLPEVLAKHPNARFFLIQYGTNDAAGLFPVPSGQGLSPGDSGYAGSFKDNMQQIIDLITNTPDGKTAYVAYVPFSLTPSKNDDIQLYNFVIENELNGMPVQFTPPDFYDHFELHPLELADNVSHPDGTGYQSMAGLWSTAINATP